MELLAGFRALRFPTASTMRLPEAFEVFLGEERISRNGKLGTCKG